MLTSLLRLAALAPTLIACTVVPETPVDAPAPPSDVEDAADVRGSVDADDGDAPAGDLAAPDLPAEPDALSVADLPPGALEVFYGGFDTALPPEEVTAGDDAGDTSDPGPVLPPHDVPRMTRWRLVWSDEFDGPPCDPDRPETCPDEATRARAVRCYGTASAPVETTLLQTFHPAEGQRAHLRRAVVPHLPGLDKCVWSVSEHTNSRHALGAAGAIMRYGAENVTVARGELRLRTRPTPGWTPAGSDCGRKRDPYGPDTEDNLGRSCPYEGAYVTSQPLNGFARANASLGSGDGRTFERGGRLELRARLAAAPGNLAVASTWASDPARFTDEYTLFAHASGSPGDTTHAVSTWQAGTSGQLSARHAWNAPQAAVVADEFHVYAATWAAGEAVGFELNEVALATRAAGSGIEGGGRCLVNRVDGAPVHLMLRALLSELAGRLDGGGQPPETVSVDYVRWWEPCAPDDPDPACVESTLSTVCPSPCGGIGVFRDGVCDLGAPPDGTTAAASGRFLGYNRGSGINPCPLGGLFVDGLCAVIAIPEGRGALTRGNRWALEPACSPTRGLANCGAPCPVAGTRWEGDKHACFYRARIPGTNSFVYANQLYYARFEGHPDGPCPHGGNFDGSNCHLGAAPAGHFAKTLGGDFYLEPHVCPDGGTWDFERKGCLLRTLADGTRAFVYADGFYYGTATPGQCAQGGRWDGANCRLLDLPQGARAFTDGPKLFLRATCTQSSDWGALAAHPGGVTLSGGACSP